MGLCRDPVTCASRLDLWDGPTDTLGLIARQGQVTGGPDTCLLIWERDSLGSRTWFGVSEFSTTSGRATAYGSAGCAGESGFEGRR